MIEYIKTGTTRMPTNSTTDHDDAVVYGDDPRGVGKGITCAFCASTVSYTHLTLPTNREV